MSDRLPSYAELAEVLNSLPLLLREARRARGLGQRDAAKQIGVTASTVCRIESGEGYHVGNAVALLRWLDSRLPASTTEETNR